jgi:hypothetical protein
LVSDIKEGTYTEGTFENRVLRKIFQRGRDEIIGIWRKSHNEELHKCYSSPDMIRMHKSSRMKGAGHAAHTRRIDVGFWWESQKEREN